MSGKEVALAEIQFDYVNWRGETAHRRARPISIQFHSSDWHKEPQWLMLAIDVEKNEPREFALRDMSNVVPDAIMALHVSGTEPKTLWGMIAKIYEGMDAEDRAWIDREWVKWRGAELTALRSSSAGSRPGREEIARTIHRVANDWLRPGLPFEPCAFDELSERDKKLHYDYADAILSLHPSGIEDVQTRCVQSESTTHRESVTESGDGAIYAEVSKRDSSAAERAEIDRLINKRLVAAAASENALYYLGSIKRQLENLKDFVGSCEVLTPSLGGEVLADNIDWLDCFIDEHTRAAQAPLSTDASACPTDGFLRSSLNQNNSPPSAGDGEPSIDLMQRVWANLYFDKKDTDGTFQQTLNEVVDWLAARNALPDHDKPFAHPTPAPEGLREALEPFARYFRLNDCEGRKDDEAIEVPIGDLRRAADALSPTKAGA